MNTAVGDQDSITGLIEDVILPFCITTAFHLVTKDSEQYHRMRTRESRSFQIGLSVVKYSMSTIFVKHFVYHLYSFTRLHHLPRFYYIKRLSLRLSL